MKLAQKFKEIHNFRFMLNTLVKQDINGRYKGSFLGFLWTLLNPLLMLLVYSLVFQYVFKTGIEHYSIYLFICLMPWNAFSNAVFTGTTCVSSNASILKKVYFPRDILPLYIVISNTIQYFFSFAVILVALLVSGVGLSWYVLLVPVVVIVQAIFSFGLILILSATNVYVRDVQYMMNPIMMIWMYACPILYSINMVPQKYVHLYRLNPMVTIMEAYQKLLYSKTMFDVAALGKVFLISIVILVLGYFIFNKLQRRFVEEV